MSLYREVRFWVLTGLFIAAVLGIAYSRKELEHLVLSGYYRPKFQPMLPAAVYEMKQAARLEYRDKRQRILDRCLREKNKTSYSSSKRASSLKSSRRLFYSQYYAFTYCSIPKTASSTMLASLSLLKKHEWEQIGMIPNERLGNPKERMVYQSEFPLPNITVSEINNNTLTFAFVRDPFSRLVSRYYASEFGGIKEILLKPIIPGGNSTYFPTPKEFLEAIINQRSLDIGHTHIVSQWHLCDFCTLDFDIIGSVETFNRDFDKLREFLKVQDIVESPVNRNMLEELSQGNYENISSRVRTFFAQVPKQLIRSLYEVRLKDDLETFGDPQTFEDILALGY